MADEEKKAIKKSELIEEVALRTRQTQKDVETIVNALGSTIKETLAEGKKVQVIGFGTFEVRNHAARTGRNPRTGLMMDIPASKTPAFRPGKTFKDKVKK